MGGSRITWAIGGAVAALLLVAGVDALRSSNNETSAPAASTSPLTSSTEAAAGQAGDPRMREYVAQARVICGRASSDLIRSPHGGLIVSELAEVAAWHVTAARIEERSLRKLRALRSPERD